MLDDTVTIERTPDIHCGDSRRAQRIVCGVDEILEH